MAGMNAEMPPSEANHQPAEIRPSFRARDLGDTCPPRTWQRENVCDVQILDYRFNLRMDDRLVEVSLRFRVERCTEDYVLGDLLYSTTLFPGEEVLLSTRTRHSIARMTDDSSFSASQVSRSSDRVWMETFKTLATDFDEETSSRLETSTHSRFNQVSSSESGGAGLFGLFSFGSGSSRASGEFDATSSREFFTGISQHLRSSYHQTNEVVRDTSAVSVTEVNSHRTVTTEVNDELKVSTRRFKNINECHTVTRYFYQIARRQRVRIELIDRSFRALNEFASTALRPKPLLVSIAANQQVVKEPVQTAPGGTVGFTAQARTTAGPAAARLTDDQLFLQNAARISAGAFQEAEQARRAAVQKAEAIIAELPEFEPIEEVTLIPTEAFYVESELGSCMLCEPYVVSKQQLELERLALENRKLRREIDLLEQSREYRCCDEDEPVGPEAPDEP